MIQKVIHCSCKTGVLCMNQSGVKSTDFYTLFLIGFLFSRYTITLIRRYLWTRKLGQSALSTTKQPVTIHDIRNFHTFLAGHSSGRETSPCSLSKDSSWTGEEDMSLSYSRKKVFLIFVFIFSIFLYTSGSHLQGQDNIGFT